MPLRVGRRIRQLVSQTLRTQRSSPARHIYPLKCPTPTRLIPAAAPSFPKSLRNLGHNAQNRASDLDALHQRITALFSAPTTQETEKELVELRHAALPSPKLVCLFAEVLAHHAYVPDVLDLLKTSRAQGIAIPPRLYEPIVFRLAARYRWADILALLEPLQPLALGKTQLTGHQLTTRLCEWRVRACAELGDFAGMERALGTFPHGITQRAWEIAKVACVKNSDPQTASRIQEVIRLARTHQQKEADGKDGKGKARAIEKLETERIVQALMCLPGCQPTSPHETSTTTRIEPLPQADNQAHITYLITTYTTPSSSINPLSHSFTPDARLAGLCVYELVKSDRVTEAAAVVAAMCRGSPFPEPASSSSAVQNTHDSPSCTLPEIFASVRPDILIFNALLKGLLATRGLGSMLPLLQIMRNVDVKPDSETAAVLLRHLDRHCAWNPGLLVDTLIDLALPIPKDYANDPAIPPRHQSIPLSIRHTNVLLSSILHAERDSTLGGGWKASSAFLKYRARPANRISPSDARLASSPDNIDPPTAGLRFKSRADGLKPVLEALRSRGVRNDSMAYALRAQRDGVVQLDPESGRQVLQRADISLGAYHYAALMAGLVECGYMDAAATVMKAAHKAGFSVDSPVLYTILVSGYGRMGIPQHAQRIFDQMLEAKIKPDAIAVDALAGAWFISGLYDRARQVIVKHWPGKGELPFAEDARLKQMINELRKLRPYPKVRRRRFQRVPTEEVEAVDQIVQAIKAPAKALPLAASVKKDTGSTSSRGFSSVAGAGLDRRSLATNGDGDALVQSEELLMLAPLTLVAPKFYRAMIRKTKANFGLLLVLMCQWFAPTSLVVTSEGDNGIEEVVVRDDNGRVTELKLPPQVVMMPNHQIYADWWYLWCLAYSMRAHADVLIILKDSLKWIPIVGWGMQFFRFIFLARSWAHDKQRLTSHLTQLARTATQSQLPFLLLLFPEGTLVSPNTRPLSAAYASKVGIEDMQHILLPRSTGLLFCLRALSPHLPALKLLDVTVAYPGIPRGGYGQAYYTLRSIFMQGVPPPRVHVHLRLYDVARDVPIGVPRGAEEATGDERAAFDKWLLARWTEKDQLMEKQLTDGRFHGTSEVPVASSVAIGGGKGSKKWDEERGGSGAVEWPIRLNSKAEILDAFCWFAPVVVGMAAWQLTGFIKSVV